MTTSAIIPFRSCPCCQQKNASTLWHWEFPKKPKAMHVVRCTHCNMVFAGNADEIDMSNQRFVTWRPKNDYNILRDNKLSHNRAVLHILKPFLPPGSRLLDYGAGACGFLRVAQEAGYCVEGINPCRYMADWAKRTFGIIVHPVFGTDFNSPYLFHAIISDQTFEHLVDPIANLRKIHSLLKPGGILYINVPNILIYKRMFYGIKCLKDFSHYNYFSVKLLTQLCMGNNNPGFSLIKKAPVRGHGARAILKWILNKTGVGDCSILLQKNDSL